MSDSALRICFTWHRFSLMDTIVIIIREVIGFVYSNQNLQYLVNLYCIVRPNRKPVFCN